MVEKGLFVELEEELSILGLEASLVKCCFPWLGIVVSCVSWRRVVRLPSSLRLGLELFDEERVKRLKLSNVREIPSV